MPTILRISGYRFFFFSNEGNEPMHIHVEKGDNYAKVWLSPIQVAKNYGFKAREINFILDIVFENINLLQEKWNGFFGNS